MPFIKPVAEEDATGPLAERFEAEKRNRGYVPNYLALFGLRFDVFEAWNQLNGAIKANMDLRRYELATLAAAQALRSSYCSLAHGLVLKEKFLTDEELVLAAEGEAQEEVDRAVMALARQVAVDAAAISEIDLAPLRRCGLTDVDIFDVILAAAARSFFTKATDATGIEPDRAYRGLLGSALSDRLAVGRPIEE